VEEPTKSIAANVFVAALVSLVLIAGTTFCRECAQYRKGNEAAARGDFAGAVAGYEAAIHMYVPFSPLVGKSAESLWAIADGFERAGNRERALIAYRSLRSSFYGVRWLFQPGSEWIARCDQRIAGLVRQASQQ
jgi:hypothetical protein